MAGGKSTASFIDYISVFRLRIDIKSYHLVSEGDVLILELISYARINFIIHINETKEFKGLQYYLPFNSCGDIPLI